MHIVQFKDKKYAVRKLTIKGWVYLDLDDYRTWRHSNQAVQGYCRGSYDKVANATQKVIDRGNPYTRDHLRVSLMAHRIFALLSAVGFIEIAFYSIFTNGHIHAIYASLIFIVPTVYLLYRGLMVQEKVLFMESGWDK